MIQPMLDFFRKEKGYAFALVLVIFIFVLNGILSMFAPKPQERSPALQQFQRAETLFQERMQDPRALKEVTERDPGLFKALQGMTVFFLGVLFLGLYLEYRLFSDPSFRAQLAAGPPVSGPPWNFGMLTKVILLFILAGFCLSIVLLVIRRWMLPEVSENFILLSHTILTDLLCLVFVVHIVHQEGGSWRDLGLRMPRGSNGVRETGIGWAGYAATVPFFAGALILVMVFSHLFRYEPEPHPLISIFLEEEKSSSMIFYSILMATVLGPMVEELFFRGFCYPIFKSKFGMKIALVLSASFFALIHANTFAFWPIFALGLGLGYVYELRQSLWAPVVLHVTHNTLFITYFFLMKTVISQYGS